MADRTGIEWTDSTWNPIVGCSVVSPGCTNCYAMRLAGTRLRNHPSRAGLTIDSKAGPVWNGEVKLYEPALDQPLRWRRPRRIFVCAHGDLFHESVPDEWIDRVFAIMALTPQHTFQVLTKRAKRMRQYVLDVAAQERICTLGITLGSNRKVNPNIIIRIPTWIAHWPLCNIWLGVSVEDQARADERIPDLLATPAAKRFISAEPLLGPVDLMSIDLPDGDTYIKPLTGTEGESGEQWPGLDWVICGSESGPGARPCDIDWVRSLRDQCSESGVAFFWKQHVENGRKLSTPELDGRTWTEFPQTIA